jgi:hypothetical protein
VNRHFRRAEKAKSRSQDRAQDEIDRAKLVRIAAAMTDADGSISGVSIIRPNGRIDYLDGDLLRPGGHA